MRKKKNCDARMERCSDIWIKEPEKYKGDITTVATIVRIAVTGKSNTPDLWSINQIIGLQTMVDRVEMVIKELEAKA